MYFGAYIIGAVSVIITNCAGPIITPEIRAAWDEVSQDALDVAELASAAEAVNRVDVALLEGDCGRAAEDWPTVRALAVMDIETDLAEGRIGQLGSETRYETLRLLDQAFDACR
jgi:hypothetical protein